MSSTRDDAATPTFSIVMPTRNRAFIIEHALRSAFAQSDGDFEVVVSDNHSRDETPAVLARYAHDPRLRAARTERDLSMPDNWEAALSRARGRWVFVLEDDCVLSKSLLARVRRAIEAQPDVALVTFGFWAYNSAQVEPASARNQYISEAFSGGVRRLRTADTLRDLFDLRVGHPMPRMYNSVVRRDLVERVKQRLGRFFLTPAPDYTAGTALLALTDAHAHVDAPLMMSNTGATSPHSSPTTFATFQKELEEGNRGGYTPIELPYVSTCNIIPESICKVKSLLRDELAGVSLRPETYLPYFLLETVRFEEEGWRLGDEWRALRRYYLSLPAAEKARAGAAMARAYGRFRARGAVRSAAYRAPVVRRGLERLARRTVYRGDELGFRDLSGAMAHLDGLLAARG